MPAASRVIKTVVVVNSARGRNTHQAKIGQQAHAGSQRQTDDAADREVGRRPSVGSDDTVQKQRDLAAFAQDGNADHHGQRQQRFFPSTTAWPTARISPAISRP